MTFNYLKKEVVDKGLCTRCGSCVGISKGGVEFKDFLGKCTPQSTEKKIFNQKYMKAACSGKEVNFHALNQFVFQQQPKNPLLGNYTKAYVGHSTDKKVREKSSSGGLITSIAIHLLETKQVDGVIMLAEDSQNPCKFIPKVVRTPQEVIECAQSKYHISPVNTILSTIEKEEGNLAFVGVPCQIHSIRKLQKAKYPGVSKIKIILGIYCGNILHFNSVKSHIKRFGIKDINQIEKLSYREGEWPGNMYIRTKDKKEYRLEKFHANYLIPFYIMKRCLTCVDLTNEFADISCGDGWSPVYEERGKGWSAIMSRTKVGNTIISEMIAQKKLYTVDKKEQDMISMHSHGLDLKKRGALIRISFRKLFGKGIPQYHLNKTSVSRSRIGLEMIISAIFAFCSTKVARFLINIVPLKIIGASFTRARNIWKSTTKNIKKSKL